MKILVVAAHPDDEVLGAGATIARLAAEGHAVDVAILGEGVTSRYASRDEGPGELVSALADQAQHAGRLLGAVNVHLLGLPDNRFDHLDLLDVVKVVEKVLDDTQPEVVLTHHLGDLNIDHGITHRAVLTATRPVPGSPVRGLYSFEVASSTEWGFQHIEPTFRPTTFVDVDAYLHLKLEAMAVYDAEGRTFPHPRSPEALTAIARRWGSVVGCEAAEPFQAVRSIWHRADALIL